MSEANQQRADWQISHRRGQACALLDDGIFVLANDAFLQRLGFPTFSGLEASSLLDHANRLEKEELRLFLQQAALTHPTDDDWPKLETALLTADEEPLHVVLKACHIRLDGNDMVELHLISDEDRKLSNRLRHQPWPVYLCLACLLAFIVIPNLILPKLNINNAPATFLPEDAPSRILNDQVREIFPEDEVIVLLFEGVALFSDGFLQAYDQLGQDIQSLEAVEDVFSLTNQDHIEGTEDGFVISPLVDINTLEDHRPAERQARAVTDRFARNTLVAADGSAIAMIIVPTGLDNSILNLRLEDDIFALVERHRLDGYLEASSGEIAIDVAQMRMILHDNMIFVPLTVLLGLLLTWLLFHRLLAVIITGVVTGAVVNSTIALYVVFNQPFNSIASILPPLLSALTMAVLVHVYNALSLASQHGLYGRARTQAAMADIRRPALYSCLTTAIGLASLGLSDIPPIRTLGLSAALGVSLIYLIVIHLLPPIIAYYDRHPWPKRRQSLRFLDDLVNKLLRISLRNPLPVIAVIMLSLVLAMPLLLRIKVETNLLEFFPKYHPMRVDTEHIEDKLVGTLPLEIILTSDDPDALLLPATLQQVRSLQTWLESLPAIDKTLSAADFIEEMHWGFHAEQPEYRAIPDDAELISQYLFIYDGEDLFDFLDSDYLNARIAINANVHGAEEIRHLMDSIRQQLQTLTELEQNGIEWDISGAGRLFADQEALLTNSQIRSLGGALGLIFLLLVISWRSLRDALLCMIPNLSPILLIFLIMGLLRINLDMATTMIASVAVGIAIDDTIHIYHGFIHRVRNGISPVLALVRTYRQAGRAVMTTTVILCCQFLILLASAFVPMGYFGLLSSIGLVAALIFDLLLLPAILILMFNKPADTTTQPVI